MSGRISGSVQGRVVVKIVTWNCNGAFRRKYDALEEFDADILVVQECEDPSQSTKSYYEWAGNYLWVGNSKNKGIGVSPRNGISLEKLDWPDGGFEQFLPCRVNDQFNLLAVWTMHSSNFEYIGQFWNYLQINKEQIAGPNTVICGDFNSNVCWDKKSRHWNHSDVVREMTEIGIHSLYHKTMNEEHGQETWPTLFLQRKKEKPYHIDYAFMSKPMVSGGSIEVGHPDQWLELSDHMPIAFNLSVEAGARLSDEARAALRKKVWDVLPKYENQFHYDEEGSGSGYTEEAIMRLWEKGLADDSDKRKVVLLLRAIMFHDRMNSESGNFEFIDGHRVLVENILERIS